MTIVTWRMRMNDKSRRKGEGWMSRVAWRMRMYDERRIEDEDRQEKWDKV
jgi:hypothetical protein